MNIDTDWQLAANYWIEYQRDGSCALFRDDQRIRNFLPSTGKKAIEVWCAAVRLARRAELFKAGMRLQPNCAICCNSPEIGLIAIADRHHSPNRLIMRTENLTTTLPSLTRTVTTSEHHPLKPPMSRSTRPPPNFGIKL